MRIASRSLLFVAATAFLAACGSESPTAPASVAPTSPSGSPAAPSSISNDLVASAGNSIATDLELLSGNETAAGIGSLTFNIMPVFDAGSVASSTPSTTPVAGTCSYDAATQIYTCVKTGPDTNWECKPIPGSTLYLCTKKLSSPPTTTDSGKTTVPTPTTAGSCVYDAATRIYTCIKTAPDTGWICVLNTTTKLYTCTKSADAPKTDTAKASTPPAPAPTPPSTEVCLLDPATHLYTCTKSVHDSLVTIRSYGYFDASGNPMASFVKGTTASVRYLTKTDGVTKHDSANYSVTHQGRDQTVSGFLGSTRIWNGSGSSTDTTIHTEGATRRTYTGVSVDTLKAVTYLEERSTNPYPLSGSSIRVMNYTVVAIGASTVTTTVSQRVVVTYNGTKDVPMTSGVLSCILHLDTHKVDSCK